MDKILECVPNFSEGNNKETLQEITAAINSVDGVYLLHKDKSPAANRTVFTFAGKPELVVEAAFRAIKVAGELIDMRKQTGVHPRIGATDVCPLIPLQNMSMEEADTFAQQLAKRVGEELSIPVFLYEHSQQRAYRKALPQIRKGQYEGLKEKMKQLEWKPDYGPAEMNESSGATIIGARDILVAFNISLKSNDVKTAEWIAAQMRQTNIGKSEHTLPKLRAIGWYMADYEQAQVSFNLLDYRVTSPLQVWEKCKQLAAQKGIELAGSEVIGLIPELCLLEAGKAAAVANESSDKQSLISRAIAYMGLNVLKPFEPEEKILEWSLEKHITTAKN